MTTLPEEAVKAAQNAFNEFGYTAANEKALRAALTAAHPHLPGVGVKKLAWIRQPLSDTLSRCDTDFGTYRTWTHDEANGKWFWSVEGGWNEANGEAPNEEAAKAAAQADYEARILSALEPSVCKTCNGRGIIGGMYRVGDGDVDGWEEPCPDCQKVNAHHSDADTGPDDLVQIALHLDCEPDADSILHVVREIQADLDTANDAGKVEGDGPTACVGEMQTSSGADYYVCVKVGDREITPHMFKERWKAEYEVAEWLWLFNGGDKPDLLAYGPLPSAPASEGAE